MFFRKSREVTAAVGIAAVAFMSTAGAAAATTAPPTGYPTSPLATAVSLTSSNNPSYFTQAVTYTARVRNLSGRCAAPGGTVTFVLRGLRHVTKTLTNGVASLTTGVFDNRTPIHLTQVWQVRYNGDVKHAPSLSPRLYQHLRFVPTYTEIGPRVMFWNEQFSIRVSPLRYVPPAAWRGVNGAIVLTENGQPVPVTGLSAKNVAKTFILDVGQHTLHAEFVPNRSGPTFSIYAPSAATKTVTVWAPRTTS